MQIDRRGGDDSGGSARGFARSEDGNGIVWYQEGECVRGEYEYDTDEWTCVQEREKDDAAQTEISAAIIEALPRLFIKYQTVPARLVDILTIPRLINLSLYSDSQVDVRACLTSFVAF